MHKTIQRHCICPKTHSGPICLSDILVSEICPRHTMPWDTLGHVRCNLCTALGSCSHEKHLGSVFQDFTYLKITQRVLSLQSCILWSQQSPEMVWVICNVLFPNTVYSLNPRRGHVFPEIQSVK